MNHEIDKWRDFKWRWSYSLLKRLGKEMFWVFPSFPLMKSFLFIKNKNKNKNFGSYYICQISAVIHAPYQCTSFVLHLKNKIHKLYIFVNVGVHNLWTLMSTLCGYMFTLSDVLHAICTHYLKCEYIFTNHRHL